MSNCYRLYYNQYSIAPISIDGIVEFIHNEKKIGRTCIRKAVQKAVIALDEEKLERVEIKLNDTFFGYFLEII